jgi:non-ribosomal peptide synthetase component F
VQLLVLTDELELAAVEEVGEIAIRTPYLALGYLGNEFATSEKFMLNPFTNQKGASLYRTGDLGRYLPDGNVEILGRKDRQVQLRGARIELSEVEAALNAHPNVRQSVVLLQERAKGKYLVAYVVVQHSIAKEWRAYLI